MASTTHKSKSKRLSHGWRKHIRRMKQEARKTGIPYVVRRAVAVKPAAGKK